MTLFIIWNRIKDGKLKGTPLCDHPSSIHKVTMEETLAISKYTSATNKAAKIVEEMEDNGIVSAANHIGKREIFLPEQD